MNETKDNNCFVYVKEKEVKAFASKFTELSEKEKEQVIGGSILTSYACSGPSVATTVASLISGAFSH